MINVLVFKEENNPQNAINRFIDVNQKGVKLDSEDILKGYLFQYNAAKVSTRWVKIKNYCSQINKDREYYPLMILFEQYFIAIDAPFIDSQYEMPDFKHNLEIRKKWEGFEAGTHLMLALKNKIKILYHLDSIIETAKILRDVCCSANPTDYFLNLFKSDVTYDKKVFVFYLCKTIIRFGNDLPKVFLVRYILDNFINENQDVDAISVVYIYALLFNLYSDISRKRENVYTFARNIDWKTKVSEQIDRYFNTEEKTFVNKSAFVHAYNNMNNNPEDTRRDCFEFQSFACIYNYLYRSNDGIYTLGAKGTKQKAYNFIRDKEVYSLEHFLLNESEKYALERNGETYTYPAKVKKYIGASCKI